MTMAEGGGDGEVERRQMWQWAAALMADMAIDGGGVVGCRRRRPTVMATEGGGDE